MGAMSGVTPTLAVRSGRSVLDSYQLPTPVEPLTPLLRDTPSPGEQDSKVVCHVIDRFWTESTPSETTPAQTLLRIETTHMMVKYCHPYLSMH